MLRIMLNPIIFLKELNKAHALQNLQDDSKINKKNSSPENK